jgi:hypothetical protein
MKNKFLITLSASAAVILFLVLSTLKPLEEKVPPQNPISCNPLDLTGELNLEEQLAFFEGTKVTLPKLVLADSQTNVLGVSNEERWIEVDISEQKLKAWEGGSLYLETAVSTGLPWYPTPQGEFRIWIKLRATKMEGGSGKYYYYLPNVPYVMFFQNDKVPSWKGYGLHGTYWHDDFGTQRSHGCVNLPTPIAEKLYYWTGPVLPAGKNVVYASDENLGTRIVIHE